MNTALARIAEDSINILVIEDNIGDVVLIQEMLEKASSIGFSVFHAPTVEMAEPQYRAHLFNVLLLDFNLPGLSGVEAVEKLRADLPGIPIIVMTGLADEKKALNTIKQGVQDYIIKGEYGNNILPRAIRYAIERKQFENRVIELVHFDQITGLINREVFLERLEGAIALSNQNGMPLAVLLISLRHFKEVTATLGHEVSNKLLKAAAVRLKECLMKQDALARLEGAEFVLFIAGNLAQPENLEYFSKGIIDTLERSFDIDGNSITIGCSIGIAPFPGGSVEDVDLFKQANIALHRAKQNPESEFQFYSQELNEELSGRIRLARELRDALDNKELVVWYQPIVDLKTDKVCGVETLVRWNHPEKGMVLPGEFVPFAEKSDLIVEITETVMQQACRDFKTWKHLVSEPFYVAINISARDFQKKDFTSRFERVLKLTGLNPKDVALEVTEGIIMDDPEQAALALTACRKAGASVFVDDFGTGYSSLGYLSKLPLDVLKIDYSFVADITTNGNNLMIATAIINLAHALNLKVVAEGIETKEQKDLLAILGCDKAQGFYFASPMPLEELTRWLQQREEQA